MRRIDPQDIVGEKFNLLTVVRYMGVKNRHHVYMCLCDCGHYVTVTRGNLMSGNTGSCGCAHKRRFYDENGNRLEPKEMVGGLPWNSHHPLWQAHTRFVYRVLTDFTDAREFAELCLKLGWHRGCWVVRPDTTKNLSADNLAIADSREALARIKGRYKSLSSPLMGSKLTMRELARLYDVPESAVKYALYDRRIPVSQLEAYFKKWKEKFEWNS